MTTVSLCRPGRISHWLGMYRLYIKNFPRAERKPIGVVLGMYRKGSTDIWCILRDGAFCGFAATMNGGSLVMLDYLATHEKCRNQGVGSAALALLLEHYRDRAFILEIESPYESCPQQVLRQHRKAFYLRCGLEQLNVMADVFGIKMELLGKNCTMDFERYNRFNRDAYSPWAASHIKKEIHPAAPEK